MASKYLPELDNVKLQLIKASEDKEAIWDVLVQPLHEELYRRQDFDFLDDLSEGQQLLLSYDYVLSQVFQGGFIQLIQNGYIGLLPPMPGWLTIAGAPEMAQVIDDVLKVYVLNRELLDQKTTVEEFAKLYAELTEFEIIDGRFGELNDSTRDKLLQYAEHHLDEFLQLI